MNHKISYLIIALLIVIGLTIAIAPASQVMAATINVPGDYSTIQAAVTAANPFDTIVVAAGTYNENISINVSNLTLQGANAGKSAGSSPQARGAESIINGGITVSANNVVINGFRINSSGASGIYLVGATTGHNISNNIVYGPGLSVSVRGIELGSNTSSITVSNNEFTNWVSGIYINPSSNNALQVTGNNFHGNNAGIGSDGLNNISVRYNNFAGNIEGFGSSNVGNNVAANYNDFVGNTDGINNYYSVYSTAKVIDATNNWWGHNTGPYDGSDDRATGGWYNPGQGDPVSDKVMYEPWEVQGGGGGAFGCFIATASYGPDDGSVETLRDFRDNFLATNPVGSALISTYYRISPPIAEFIDDHPTLKPVVRIVLLPSVVISTLAVNVTLAGKVAFVALLLIALTFVVVRQRGNAIFRRF